jgi:hypothetical protein
VFTTVLATLIAASVSDPTLSSVDVHSPDLAAWLTAWSSTDTVTAISSFVFESSRGVCRGAHCVVADSGVTYASFSASEARNWVLSPDSSYAVRFLPNVDAEGYPMTEPDSEVWLCEFARGRQRTILYCGTACDFEIAAWLDAETVLIGGADWENLRPVLYRVVVTQDALDVFVGPRLPEERRDEIGELVRDLWEARFPWIDWHRPNKRLQRPSAVGED